MPRPRSLWPHRGATPCQESGPSPSGPNWPASLASPQARRHASSRSAAETLSREAVSAEVIDVATLKPLDAETIVGSIEKTGRCVIVHEAPRTCGFGAELIASIQERAIEYLEAPILRVTGFDTPFPYTLEHEYMPNAERVLIAIRKTLEW